MNACINPLVISSLFDAFFADFSRSMLDSNIQFLVPFDAAWIFDLSEILLSIFLVWLI